MFQSPKIVLTENEKINKKQHISEKDRVKIEALVGVKCKPAEIAEQIGCSERTIKREIKRGTVKLITSELIYYETYKADYAQAQHEKRAKNKGRYAKINNNPELRKYVENKIKKEKYSPEAALLSAKNDGIEVDISVKTLYNSIDRGDISIKRRDLLRKEGWAKEHPKPRKGIHTKGLSIEERPEEANNRSELGHWEGDLVVSGRNGAGVLLTLTDRKSREEIIVKLPNREQKSVESALEKMKNKNFKTITWDNGSEFLNFNALQNASGAVCYYSHPYSSWERGSNENANGIIRRFFPKGTDFSKVPIRKIQQVQNWMNNYPRKILDGLSPNLFLAKPVIYSFNSYNVKIFKNPLDKLFSICYNY